MINEFFIDDLISKLKKNNLAIIKCPEGWKNWDIYSYLKVKANYYDIKIIELSFNSSSDKKNFFLDLKKTHKDINASIQKRTPLIICIYE